MFIAVAFELVIFQRPNETKKIHLLDRLHNEVLDDGLLRIAVRDVELVQVRTIDLTDSSV